MSVNPPNEKILDKIKKLMALGTSSNENEANAALGMVSELMARHQISQQQLDLKMDEEDAIEYQKRTIAEDAKAPSEAKFIFPILSKFFGVKVITTSRDRKTKIDLVGTPENIEIAKYVYDQLSLIFRCRWYDYKAKYNARTALKQTFYMNMYKGLDDKMSIERGKVEQELALVVVEDPNLDNAVNEFFGKTRKTSTKVTTYADVNAQREGYAAGQAINLRQGLKQGNQGGYLT